ncbi:FMN-linked oxidoreductase [Agrocybe pediades]|nr:FMN-linked oxidoreductase [Agrocybe pediades]
MTTTKALLQPLQLGDITLKNRITMAAMTRNRTEDTYPTELMKKYYVQRAQGGAGLIVSEGILVSHQGAEWSNAPVMADEKHVAGWRVITDAVHQAGSYIYVQLGHVGRLAHPEARQQKLSGLPVYGPSAIAARGGKFRELPGVPGYVTPVAIEDPWVLINQFKQAITKAKAAGFDGVEIHGAYGHLIPQFLDSTSNNRTDQWGGSVENRTRFALEIVKAAIEVFGKNVGLKLSPAGGQNDVGMPLQETLETFSYLVSEADKLGVAYIALVRCTGPVVIDGVDRATPHDVIESYVPFIKRAKVILNGAVSLEEGESLVASGKVDAVSIGLHFIAHPDLVRRFEREIELDRTPNFERIFPKVGEDLSLGYTDYVAVVA